MTASKLHPNSTEAQAALFVEKNTSRDDKPDTIKHDKDTGFTKEFSATEIPGLAKQLAAEGESQLERRCERVIEMIKLECLRKFIVFGKRHLDFLVSEFVDYYNTRRAHMERDHLPPIRDIPDEVETLTMDQIEVKSYVGGLVKSFERRVA